VLCWPQGGLLKNEFKFHRIFERIELGRSGSKEFHMNFRAFCSTKKNMCSLFVL
jgi:hypothetical protein